MRNLILIFLLIFSSYAHSQALTEITGIKFYEHHGPSGVLGDSSAYDFVNHQYKNARLPTGVSPDRDMVEHNGLVTTMIPFGFTSGSSSVWNGLFSGNGTTKYQLVTGFNYTAATQTSIVNAYNSATASTTVATVTNGQIYVAKIRNLNYYVVIKVTGVNVSTTNDFTFDYKYTSNPIVSCSDSYDTLSPTVCFSYLSPSGKTFTASNTYLDTIPNKGGCDSIITLNLTIDSVDVSIMQTGVTLMANAAGASYRWLDCNGGYQPLAGETAQSFIPQVNGNYAVEVDNGNCLDTSVCTLINSVSLLENSLNQEVQIYPNPTNGNVFLKFENQFSHAEVKLRSVSDQVLEQYSFNVGESFEINLDQYSGIYFLEVTIDDKRGVFKIVKH